MEHALTPFLADLAGFESTPLLEQSSLYARLRPEIERMLATVVHERLGVERFPPRDTVRAVAWNLERGQKLDGIVRVLGEHPDVSRADIFLFSELDHGMARSGNQDIAREIAKRLELHYAFAPCYLNLAKGAGREFDAAGENDQAIHGNAVMSRHPLRDPQSLALPPGRDVMRGREKRIGCERAVIATVLHPAGSLRAVSVHLDAHSTRRHRQQQMQLILDHVDRLEPALPVLIGGDFNTSTYNSQRAATSILGYCRRVLMGVKNVIRNHYPHPDRHFERALFRTLEARGYGYRELNQIGACTWNYHVSDQALNQNLGEWLPGWCFWFIRQALALNGGSCAFKLDWFAGRGIRPASGAPAPRVITDADPPEGPLSDHMPIAVDFAIGSGAVPAAG